MILEISNSLLSRFLSVTCGLLDKVPFFEQTSLFPQIKNLANSVRTIQWESLLDL